MAELRVLTPRRDRASEKVVELLEIELAKARRGELVGVALAGVYADGTGHHAWSAMSEAHSLLGAVGILQHALAAEILSRASDGEK